MLAVPIRKGIGDLDSVYTFNGFFEDVYSESLAEQLLFAPNGAVAVWALSGFTPPTLGIGGCPLVE